MKSGSWFRFVLLITAGLTTAAVMSAPVAEAGVPRCLGRKATIVGTRRGDLIKGTRRADVIVGLGGADVIKGLGGNDTICGGKGNDKLLGGSGNFDVLSGEPGDDELLGGDGYDVLLGGDGDDVVNGGGGGFDIAEFFFAPGPVTADLSAGTATGEGSDTLVGIENLEGSRFDDTLIGDAGANRFWGQDGNDAIDGGDGSDYAAFDFADGSVTANLDTGTATGEGTDTLTGIENLFGSDFDDTLTGDAGDNSLYGSDGDDTLDGLDGNDTLVGGAGTDTCNNGEDEQGCEG